MLIAIRTIEVIAGHFPPKPLKKVLAYITQEENQQQLMEAFYQLNPHIKRI